MKHLSVHLFDLPDELLLTIMKKLKPNDVLYSLLGVNKRFDRLAGSTSNTTTINFTNISSTGENVSMEHHEFQWFCLHIMPQICHNVKELVLDQWPMERVLLACEYPLLRHIVFSIFEPNIILNCLKDGSPVARLFKEQIEIIHVLKIKRQTSNELFTDACVCILRLCTNLAKFDSDVVGLKPPKLSIHNRPPNTCLSSTLLVLSVHVASFDDCLCLLDGRLPNLLSFSVKMDFISETPSMVDNTKLIHSLHIFSITSNDVRGYDQQVLPLLHRMVNVKRLILCLVVTRSTFIDGIHLEREILTHLTLDMFTFHIRTIVRLLYSHDHLLADDIHNTFCQWKYGQVNCHVDYIEDIVGQCHIYSVPFEFRCLTGVTNSFFGNSFHLVIDLKLFDVRPFENVYFKWIARALPLLKYLTIDNRTSQQYKVEVERINGSQNSTIRFPQLMMITLTNAHIDYVHQFLRHTNSHIPCFCALIVNYEKLVAVTNNFTSDLTRVNCAQLKLVKIEKEIVYPKHFYDYFPFL